MINKLWTIVLSLLTRRARRRQTAKVNFTVIKVRVKSDLVPIPVQGLAETSSPFRLQCPDELSKPPPCDTPHPVHLYSSSPSVFVFSRENGYYERRGR